MRKNLKIIKMKKLLLSVLAVTFFTIQSIAQIYVGEEAKDVKKESKQEESPKANTKSSSRYKDRYIHLGYFSPKMEPSENYEYGPFTPNAHPKYGLFLEKGKYRFYRDNFIFKNNCNIGLYSGFSIGFLAYDFGLPDSFSGLTIPYVFVDYKLGPDFRYEISDVIILDLYGNVGISMSGGGYVQDGDGISMYNPTMPAFAFQSGVGLDVSFGAFIVGTQLNFAKAKYKYDVVEDDNFGSTETVSEQYDVLINSFKVHIGFMFK